MSTELRDELLLTASPEVRPQEVGGIILKRNYKGDVKKAESLYQIDPLLFQATLNSAQAELAKNQSECRTGPPDGEPL